MKNNKKVLLLLCLLIVCLAFILIVQTYAKYISSASGDTTFTIANWNIKVNTLSITDNTDISNTIVPVFPGNENIASNIIAPTAEGYFDLEFDFTSVDVSFKYEIETSVDEASSVKDLVAMGYSVDDGPIITFTNYNEIITDTIPLDSDITSRKIRVYIIWNDDETTATMNNESDTLSTVSDTSVLFHVNVTFTQVV